MAAKLLLCALQCAADDTDPRHGARTRPLRIGHRGNSDMPASSLTGDRIGRSGYATLQDGQKQGPITFSLLGTHPAASQVSSTSTISMNFQRREVMPAAIAGVLRKPL